MSACVSPPQLSVSHIVEVAAIIAHAASTALPPFMNVAAPAVAASGLPVTATQFCPCSGGLTVLAGAPVDTNARLAASAAARRMECFMRQLYPVPRVISARMASRIENRPGDAMTEVILHHYPMSPYAEKARKALGIKRL